MTEQEMMQVKLYSEVVADPRSDVPRRALAAWLAPRWPERAEFIMLDLRYSEAARRHLWHAPDALEPQAPTGGDLLRKHRERWGQPVEQLRWASKPFFVRGFVEGVTMTAAAFLEHADELFALFPILHLDIEDPCPVFEELVRSPYLARLVSLNFRNTDMGDRELSVLASCSHFDQLCRLRVYGSGVTDAGVESVIAAARSFPSIHVVSVGGPATSEYAESWGADATTGWPLPEAINMPPFGIYLEKKYGYLPFLHLPTLMPGYPPTVADFDILEDRLPREPPGSAGSRGSSPGS